MERSGKFDIHMYVLHFRRAGAQYSLGPRPLTRFNLTDVEIILLFVPQVMIA